MKAEPNDALLKQLTSTLARTIERDDETVEAFSQLYNVFPYNSLEYIDDFKSQFEVNVLNTLEPVLTKFGNCVASLKQVVEDCNELNRDIGAVCDRVRNTKGQTNELLERIKELQDDRKNNEILQQFSKAYLDTFVLVDTDQPSSTTAGLSNLNHTNASGGIESLFETIEKAEDILNKSRLLMKVGPQAISLDVLEKISSRKEAAMEKIYKWTLSYCRHIGKPEFTSAISKAMAKLKERPALFQHILSEYTTMRRSIFVEEFIKALTQGSPSGNATAIELHANDSQIYLTDMFVWLCKFIQSEAKLLHQLLDECQLESDDTDKLFTDTLSNICEGVSQPLKIRIEKVLLLPMQPSLLYSLTNLIRYYSKSISKLSVTGALTAAFDEMKSIGEQTFLTSFQKQINGLLLRTEPPGRDLAPTPTIHHVITSIMRNMMSTASLSEGRDTDMPRIADIILEPLLRTIQEQAARLPTVDMAVYLLNCLFCLHSCLCMYEYMEDRLERLDAQAEAQIDTLTSEQASHLVAHLNLNPIYSILQTSKTKNIPMSQVVGVDAISLKSFGDQLELFLQNPDKVFLSQIFLLSCFKYRKEVQRRAFEVFIAIYKQLHAAVLNDTNFYTDAKCILRYNVDDLSKILFALLK